MTDKVQKILSEIATRKLCTMDEHMAFYNDKAKEDYRFLSEIEELIKVLQEEPVSDELEKVVEEIVDPTVLNAYGVKEIANRLRKTMIEPVSKELEEAAEEYIKYTPRYDIGYELEEGNDPTEIDCFTIDEATAAFIEGAKWQKQKDNIPVSDKLEEACEQLAENARKHKAETSSPFFNQTDYRQGVIDGAKWQKENLWKSADGDDLPKIDREVIVLIKDSVQRNIHAKEYLIYRIGFGHRPNPDGWDGKNIDTDKVTHYTPKLYDKGGWNSPNIAYWLDIELPKEIEL